MRAEPLVVDANVLFSALLRDGTTRHIILHGGLDLHTPEALWDELERNRAYLLRKSGATEAAFDRLLELLRDRIASIPLEVIRPHLREAHRRLGPRERLDAPYVAAAMAIRGTVWSHDKPLARKAGVRCVTTRELLQGG
jgi:predicted nucleic acid-binding protein